MSLTPTTDTGSEQPISLEELLRAISMPLSTRDRPLRTERINVAHVADALRRYPGERLRFFTRVQAREDLAGFNLEILVPDGVKVHEAVALVGDVRSLPAILTVERATYVVWKIERPIEAGSEFEFCTDCVVQQREDNVNILSRALLTARSQEHGDAVEDEEISAVFVSVQARYTHYLPALYAQDRFMNRFLMLFESFWEPIQQQIAGIDNYFDPTVTPPDFLPWLSSWIALSTPQEEETSSASEETGGETTNLSLDSRRLLPGPSSTGGAPTTSVVDGIGQAEADDAHGASGAGDGLTGVGLGADGLGADGFDADGFGSDSLYLVDADDSGSRGITPSRKLWQARQVFLPLPAGAAGQGGLGSTTDSVGMASDDGQRAHFRREPLILPTAAENSRKLLKVAQQLHKRRGTRRGLQQYLEIFTDTEVQVIEHRAENFVIAQRGALGSRVALGHDNHPHSFTVIIRFYVPQQKLVQLGDAVVEKRKHNVRRRVIPIIEEQKPAHTTYHLKIEVIPI